MLNIALKFGNEKGMVLPLGLMFLAIIAILGTTAVIITTTDLKIGTNYKLSEQAFYAAEAGVQEAIFRISLVNDSTKTIAQWGSQVSINGVANAYIGDPSSGGYDPNWQVKIYFVEDATTLTSPDTATLLPKANWPNMDYEVTIRHEKESDIGNDLNGDGDTNDLVFYNPSAGKNATGAGKPITWIESIGKSGTSQHKIHVEATKEVFAVDSKAAIVVNNPPNFSGNSSILGFNFKKETDPDFIGNTRTIDEIKGRINDPLLTNDHYGDKNDTTVVDVETGDVAIAVPYADDGSGNWMLQTSGHLPGAAITTGATISPSGSNAVFGGNGTKAWKDETIPSWLPIQDVLFDPLDYPDAGERLTMLNDLLAKADITDADLENDKLKSKEPMGIIHITGDIDLANDTPTPASGYGEGLMYIEGNLKVTGNVNFKGLIFVEGDVDISATFWNLGTILVKGTTTDMLGNATTLYSKEVMDDLEDFTKTVKIISWRDVF